VSLRLQLGISRGDGALVRALGLIERRGYRVTSVATHGATVVVELETRPTHGPLENLMHQLLKLEDVESVQEVREAAG
jgi:acetolactate synthase regulatory subunit